MGAASDPAGSALRRSASQGDFCGGPPPLRQVHAGDAVGREVDPAEDPSVNERGATE